MGRMKQFLKILKFELLGYFKNKIFVGITLFLVVALAIVMSLPRIAELFSSDEPKDEALPIMLVAAESEEDAHSMKILFESVFDGRYTVEAALSDEGEIKKRITSGEVECAVIINSLTSYTYYVNNLSMYDVNTSYINEVMETLYRVDSMVNGGLTTDEAYDILSTVIECETVNLGKDQMENFLYTYIMIFALYMVILLYGQMVATNVASEKSSRAMELLVTSVDPVAMMFGKVIASSLAGLCQLALIFGTALVSFNLNKEYWKGMDIVSSMFNIPVELFIYMLVFFILGFFIYAFLFGAIGSTASKIEDVNTSVMPITFLFIIGFMIVMFSMSSGTVDTALMKVCSYIPFTSPMAMFTRIAMSTVPFGEVVASIVILVVSVILVGILSARIYRMGVLLYGTPPKLGAIIREIRRGGKNK